MMILHKDGKGMTNSDNMTRMAVNGLYVTAYMVDGSNHSIGRYETEDDAKKAFDLVQLHLKKS